MSKILYKILNLKTIKAYPNSTVESALENVFSFDYYNKSVKDLITRTFMENGFKFSSNFLKPSNQSNSKSVDLSIEFINTRSSGDEIANSPKHGKVDPTKSPHV